MQSLLKLGADPNVCAQVCNAQELVSEKEEPSW